MVPGGFQKLQPLCLTAGRGTILPMRWSWGADGAGRVAEQPSLARAPLPWSDAAPALLAAPHPAASPCVRCESVSVCGCASVYTVRVDLITSETSATGGWRLWSLPDRKRTCRVPEVRLRVTRPWLSYDLLRLTVTCSGCW